MLNKYLLNPTSIMIFISFGVMATFMRRMVFFGPIMFSSVHIFLGEKYTPTIN